MIDLHCHLLPGLDDGPVSLESALALAQLQVAAGVRVVAATPHVSPGMPNDAATIADGVTEMRVALRAAAISLEVVSGAEVDLGYALELSDEELRGLALGDGPWILLEVPLQPDAPLEPIVARLRARGHEILLAHPERSPMLQRNPAMLHRLVGAGVLSQITARSLVGAFGRVVQRFSERLVEDGLVHVLASDAHDVQRRPPGLSAPALEAGLAGELHALTHEIPAAIIAGEHIERGPHPARRARRGLLARLLRS
jgi:protein-tyrosine phosphatase